VVFKEYPKLKQKKEDIEKDEGIIFALMTGSGSTLYKVIATN